MTDIKNQNMPASSASARPLGEPLFLGHPVHEQAEPPRKKSFLDRLRKRQPDEPAEPTPPFEVVTAGECPPLVTVYGPPGSGKTTLLCSLLEQFRGHCAYIVHDGDLLYGMRERLGLALGDDGDVWWEGLTDVTLDQWAPEADLPRPPAPGDIPRGSLVVFDLGFFRQVVTDERSADQHLLRERVTEWLSFEDQVARLARSQALTVASSVLTEDTKASRGVPLESCQSPLGGASIQVRASEVRGPSGLVYDVQYPMGGPAGQFTLRGGERA